LAAGGLKYKDLGMQCTDMQVDGKHKSFNPIGSVKLWKISSPVQILALLRFIDVSPTTSFRILIRETGFEFWERDYISPFTSRVDPQQSLLCFFPPCKSWWNSEGDTVKRVYVTYPASRVEVETHLDNLISIFMISNFNVKTKSWNFSSDDVACFSLTFVEPDNAPTASHSVAPHNTWTVCKVRQRFGNDGNSTKGPFFSISFPLKVVTTKICIGIFARNSELMWEWFSWFVKNIPNVSSGFPGHGQKEACSP